MPVPSPSPAPATYRSSTVVLALLVAGGLLLTGCSRADGQDGAVSGEVPSTAGDVEGEPTLEVSIEDGDLEVREGSGASLVTHEGSEAEGEAVHAVVRPGEREHHTVLALYRVDPPELDLRYELRYLTVDADGASDLYWFPWRLQVHAELVAVRDVAPVPVWFADGSAIAWIEWNGQDTILRIVGWRDTGTGSNPSDDVASYRLSDVEPGTQLQAWPERDRLRATSPDGEVLELELNDGALALAAG